MSTKPNYFKIGLFVILGVLLMAAAVVYFGAERFRREKTYSETCFDGSVEGLAVGAPVRLRGVKIGIVEKIAFAETEYDIRSATGEKPQYGRYMLVVMSSEGEILKDVSYKDEEGDALLERLIDEGLRLRIASRGITGVSYIQAEFLDPEKHPVMELPWQPKRTYIPSAPSTGAKLMSSIENIVTNIEELDLDGLVVLMSRLLITANKAVGDAEIGKLSKEARSLLSEVRQTNTHLQKLLKDSAEVIEAAEIPDLLNRLNSTLTRIDRLLASKKPDIEEILDNFKDVSAAAKELLESIRNYPAEAIFRKRPPE